jgi:two-component system, NtrC family, response regulator AtoC
MIRVLVVDDDLGYRRGLEFLLSQSGHDVRTASSGEEAIALGQSFRPDVLVVDWSLHGRFTGLDVAKELTRANPALKAILTSGFASGDLRMMTASVSLFRILEKPFDPRELLAAVSQAAALLAPDAAPAGGEGPTPTGGESSTTQSADPPR